MKELFRVLFVLLAAVAVSGCSKPEIDKVHVGEVRFLIEPQCEVEARGFLIELDEMKGFSAGVSEINYKMGVYPDIRYLGVISSDLVNTSDLQAYVNGAVRGCRAKRQFVFDLQDSASVQDFASLITMSDYARGGGPLFLRVQGAKVIVNTLQ